jgi:hypothetical protein
MRSLTLLQEDKALSYPPLQLLIGESATLEYVITFIANEQPVEWITFIQV